MDETKPWWRKKRWWGAGLALLLATYPLSVGPMEHAARRGWLPMEVTYYGTPAMMVALRTPLADPYARYVAWWLGTGDLPDYECVVFDGTVTFMPADRRYHRSPMPHTMWRLGDGF